ncbi:hypothetical protein PC129_g16522 [Phytophthora cactorum]|uniref:Uncharacterized protein n=1 Tax=Phytophthora cactorum TaxID=29920 RepID=A0A329SXB2_9STRA|nr:hypothetical protein GQ600_9001 [Phytophthora cactorum]KAG2785220.1 hypothetical protein Pcac1_g5195 [Phytophthora cactorum]KAG2802246.1 hypothetical protein PC112_g19707 [Phytophthora cactorum]KAG2803086.1 hypothetical protein PC111_g18828 [Phytophthora cactorum]KAG2839093.1 hypothetical protein PC113_g19533 [Phytophthora cactorum]
MTLDCAQRSLANCQQLRLKWEAFGRRLKDHERHLETRKNIIQWFLLDIAPSSPSSVQDPMIQVGNAEDTDRGD